MRKDRLFRLAVIVLIASSLLVVGCSNTQVLLPDPNMKVLRVALTDARMKLDSHVSTYGINEIINNVVEPLVHLQADGSVLPLLLKNLPTVSSDGLIYAFELKSEVKFHNGDILTSSDVKFTIERCLDPLTKAVNTHAYMPIKGALDFALGQAQEVIGVKIIDDTKFEIELEEPFASFIIYLGTEWGVIYPESACREAGQKWGAEVLVGTGPYVMTSFDQVRREIVLDRFAEYHGATPKIDRIVIRLFADLTTARMEFDQGNIDIVEVGANYATDPKYSDMIISGNMYGGPFIRFNLSVAPFDDVRIRQAISLSIDREAIAKASSGQVIAAKGYLAPGISGYTEEMEPYEYNPAKAKQLLADAGYPDGIDLDYWGGNDDSTVVIQDMLRSSGIRLNIRQMDPVAGLEQLMNGTITMTLGFCMSHIPDTDFYLHIVLSKDMSKQFGMFYNNPEVERLIGEERRTMDPEKRREIFEQINHIVSKEDLPVIPLTHPIAFLLVRPNVTGIKYDGAEIRAYQYDMVR